MRKCAHRTLSRLSYDAVQRREIEHTICVTCGETLPLGPARDDGPHAEQVATEIRAAELVAEWKPKGGVSRIIEPEETRGWSGWPYRQPETEGEHTGFLAAQIMNHEGDMGQVNWVGRHMADHAIVTHDKETP